MSQSAANKGYLFENFRLFHLLQKVDDAGLRLDLVNIKLLDTAVDARHDLLRRKRKIVFFLQVAGRLLQAHGSDRVTQAGLRLFSEGAEVDFADIVPDVHGIKESSVEVEDRTVQLHAFTISSDSLRS